MSDPADLVREYYRALDAHAYEALVAVLAPGFRQVRGDRTFEDREQFVRFMRENRPEPNTEHVLDGVYPVPTENAADVVVEGTVMRPDGSPWFRFVDVFEVDDDRLEALRTYTR